MKIEVTLGEITPKAICVTERQAIICERALNMVQCGLWPQFCKEIEDFTGQTLEEDECIELENVLRHN